MNGNILASILLLFLLGSLVNPTQASFLDFIMDITGSEVPYQTVYSGTNGSEGITERVIKNETEFKALLSENCHMAHIGTGAIGQNVELKDICYAVQREDIDFYEYTFIYISTGTKPHGGYDVVIDKIIEMESKIEVRYVDKMPPENSAAYMAVTHPYIMIAIKKTDKNIYFESSVEKGILNQEITCEKVVYQFMSGSGQTKCMKTCIESGESISVPGIMYSNMYSNNNVNNYWRKFDNLEQCEIEREKDLKNNCKVKYSYNKVLPHKYCEENWRCSGEAYMSQYLMEFDDKKRCDESFKKNHDEYKECISTCSECKYTENKWVCVGVSCNVLCKEGFSCYRGKCVQNDVNASENEKSNEEICKVCYEKGMACACTDSWPLTKCSCSGEITSISHVIAIAELDAIYKGKIEKKIVRDKLKEEIIKLEDVYSETEVITKDTGDKVIWSGDGKKIVKLKEQIEKNKNIATGLLEIKDELSEENQEKIDTMLDELEKENGNIERGIEKEYYSGIFGFFRKLFRVRWDK